MNMKINEFESLHTAAQDILDGVKPFDEIGTAIHMTTASRNNDPWMQARMNNFPGTSAAVHAVATRAIGLCIEKGDAVVVEGDTAWEHYLSLVWPIDEQAGDIVAELSAANTTFKDALDYSQGNHEVRCKFADDEENWLTIRRRGKIAPDLTMRPIPEFTATALTNNIHQTAATVMRDALWACARSGSLPEPEELTANAWDRYDMYAGLSTIPGQMFNIAALGREVAKIKKENIIKCNDNKMLNPPSWIEALDEYVKSGSLPDFAYTMAPSLLLTDEQIAPSSPKHGLCAGQTVLRPYTITDVARPTDEQISHFLKKSNRMTHDGGFAAIDYHFTRSIEVASQTIFADPVYRQAISSMVSSLLKFVKQ